MSSDVVVMIKVKLMNMINIANVTMSSMYINVVIRRRTSAVCKKSILRAVVGLALNATITQVIARIVGMNSLTLVRFHPHFNAGPRALHLAVGRTRRIQYLRNIPTLRIAA